MVGGAVALVAASTALASSSVSDAPGDANDAPDISSVTVTSAAATAASIEVGFANFETLPENTQVTVRLDLDANPGTGVNGFELVVSYSTGAALAVSRFDGIRMAPVDASGASVKASVGALTFRLDRGLIGTASSLGVSVVASRTQQVGAARIVSSDFAPEAGEDAYAPPGAVTFPDPRADEDAAPDITSVDVADAPGNPVTFRIATPNYPSLPPGKEIGLVLALAGRSPPEDELFLTYVSTGGQLVVEREEHGLAVPVDPPAGAEASYESGVLVVSLDRRELEGSGAFRFGVVTADLVGLGEGEGPGSQGELEAVDVAPDGLLDGKRYTYRLVNPPPLRLAADAPVAVPLVPVAGRGFEVSVRVRRSDAFDVVRTGTVSCAAAVAGTRLRASGAFVHGRARCRLLLPRTSRAVKLRGTMTIRAAGKTVTARFSFPVRH